MIERSRESLTFILFLFTSCVFGQNVFSEKNLDVPKSFLPYDVPYTFDLEDKQFVQLSEVKGNTMTLGRYDQYFFEQWEKEVDFNKNESAPQIYISGDTIVVFSFTSFRDKGFISVTFRLFDLKQGAEIPGSRYQVQMLAKKGVDPKLAFSPDRRKFIIYNYHTIHEGTEKATFTVFERGNTNALAEYYLESDNISSFVSNDIQLSDNGDVFFVSIEPGDYKAHAFFISHKFQQVQEISNNFFFERPIDAIGAIDIIRQGVSSYFVSFASSFENELVGFNVAGYNVILKTVMFSYNQNLRKEEIEAVYNNYYTTAPNQRGRFLEVPKTLENFLFVKSIVNPENDVILIFEESEIPKDYFNDGGNMSWKARLKKEKYYSGGDILLFCFSAGGELLWQKCIQKTQESQASGLGLSFMDRTESENLHMLMHESSEGGSFYIVTLNMLDGSLVNTINLLPNKKFEFTRKYSCWLDNKSVLVCGIAPANIYKRTLMLVEF